MKTNLHIAATNGFLYVDGKLKDYQFISADLDFETGRVTYTCKLGGEETTFATDTCPLVYKDEQAFRGEEILAEKVISWTHALNAVGIMTRSADDSLHAIVDGEIVEVPAPARGFLYAKGELMYVGKGRFFGSREEALLYYDVIRVDENGEESVSVCPAKRIALDEEQRKAVDAVRDAIAGAKALGVCIVFDYEDETLHAYSNKQVAITDYDYCRDIVTQYGVRINDLMHDVGEQVRGVNLYETGVYVRFE